MQDLSTRSHTRTSASSAPDTTVSCFGWNSTLKTTPLRCHRSTPSAGGQHLTCKCTSTKPSTPFCWVLNARVHLSSAKAAGCTCAEAAPKPLLCPHGGRARVAAEDVGAVAAVGVPHPHRPIRAPAGQQAPRGIDRHVRHGRAVAL
jgi:hypothetical protein